jgi:hypothetical protein
MTLEPLAIEAPTPTGTIIALIGLVLTIAIGIWRMSAGFTSVRTRLDGIDKKLDEMVDEAKAVSSRVAEHETDIGRIDERVKHVEQHQASAD